jgi:FG-GAP repeat
VFGTDQGFPAVIDLADGADVVIQGASEDSGSGGSVSGAGDVNGDGLADLLVGDPRADPNGRGAGASYVVFGSAHDFPATIDLASDADLIIQGAAREDGSGASVSGAGDPSGDGFADLLIHAPGAAAGTSYLVLGGPVAAIERLIARVEAADLPRRLERSLTRKLSKAVDNVAEGKITRAMFRLRAFVHRVKGRQGKNIDQADADLWVANARAIIDMLRPLRQLGPASERRALSAMVPAP